MAVSVIEYGMGYIGQMIVELCLRKGVNVVGAIDTDANLIGRDVGEIIGWGSDIGVKVTNDVQGLLKSIKADIVCHATATKLEPAYDQIKPFIEAGLNVVSISEELAYPWHKYPELSVEIDKNAKSHSVTVVGTGVNPGFAMDLLPVTAASVCWDVNKIKVQRVADLSFFSVTRGSLRWGKKPDEFRKGILDGTIPMHTGLVESATMIADALGWKLDGVSETWEPVFSKSVRKVGSITVNPGESTGVIQRALGTIKREVKVELIIYFMFHPVLEEDGIEPGGKIWIEGKPNVTIETKGTASMGHYATSARLVNIIPAVLNAKPGLISVLALPLR